MAVRCDKLICKHNKLSGSMYFCKRNSGYDYLGGDIKIKESGYCGSYERKGKGK